MAVLPECDFSKATKMSAAELLDVTLARIRERVRSEQQYFAAPMMPEPGGSDAEIDALERKLGIELAHDYRAFLRRARWAVLDDFDQVWGLPFDGPVYGSPWVSGDHVPGRRVLVFGYYGAYGDGDQLVMPIDGADRSVFCYLHERGPLVERFAPSFGLALWRLAFENR